MSWCWYGDNKKRTDSCVDYRSILDGRKILLEGGGPSSIEAGRIETTLQIFASHPLDEIVFDYGIPGMSGIWSQPLEVGRTLFRVLQEAVHNSSKHSGVKRVEVLLREESSEIHLVVRDLGRGFQVKPAFQGKGLGLTSMRERVRLVNGTIEIESQPMCGTTIQVRVPRESEHSSQRMAE